MLTARSSCAFRVARLAALASAVALTAPRSHAGLLTYTVTELGLDDDAHTGPNGEHSNAAWGTNAHGDVIGTSYNYDERYSTAWVYRGGAYQVIGLYDGNAVNPSTGRGQLNIPVAINDQGDIIGRTRTYPNPLGQEAWLYRAGDTQPTLTTLTTPDYLRSGRGHSTPLFLDSQARVIGSSRRWSPSIGTTLWRYDQGQHEILGLTGDEYVRDNGEQLTSIMALHQDDRVLGNTFRYADNGSYGQQAWVQGDTGVELIGPNAAELTRADGFRSSHFSDKNSGNGVYWGQSERFDPNAAVVDWDREDEFTPNDPNSRGRVAWVTDLQTTRVVGPSGGVFTSSAGTQYASVAHANSNGVAVGIASSYYDSSPFEANQGFYDDGVSVRIIGDLGPEADRDSNPQWVNASGMAVGYTTWRRPGGGDPFQASWLYDPSLDESAVLTLDTLGMTDPAGIYAQRLLDDNTVLGIYYPNYPAASGSRFFAWRDGVSEDLGPRASGGGQVDWDAVMNSASFGNGDYYTFNSGTGAFLLTLEVPEPGTGGLVCVLGAACARRRRRRRRSA